MGEYLAYQIFIGKLDYETIINTYPQYKDTIDEYLKNKFDRVMPIERE